jgi:hypothetical protein
MTLKEQERAALEWFRRWMHDEEFRKSCCDECHDAAATIFHHVHEVPPSPEGEKGR